MKGARNNFGNARGIVHLDGPFRHGAEDLFIIDFLKRPTAAHGAFDLADEHDQWHAVVFGNMDRMGAVHRARSARRKEDADLAGQPRIGVGHDACACLLTCDSDLDLRVVKGIEHGEIGFARHAEDMLDTLQGELVD